MHQPQIQTAYLLKAAALIALCFLCKTGFSQEGVPADTPEQPVEDVQLPPLQLLFVDPAVVPARLRQSQRPVYSLSMNYGNWNLNPNNVNTAGEYLLHGTVNSLLNKVKPERRFNSASQWTPLLIQ